MGRNDHHHLYLYHSYQNWTGHRTGQPQELEPNKNHKKPVDQILHKTFKIWKKYIYLCASIRIQTIIHKYAKFLIYIARVHITKITLSAIHIWPKIHKQRGSKWPVKSKKLDVATNIYKSSKSLPILGSHSSIAPCSPFL